MNHCLRVSEVVSTVYAFLQPKHALDLALTCRTLLEPGLDEIWRDIQSFDPLIACMPEDLWREEFAPDEHEQLGCKVLFLRRELKREDLDDYLTRYAKRVRFFSLHLKGGSRVLSGEALHALALVMDFRPGVFAPLLKQFGWPCDLDLQYFFGESVSRSLPPHMPLFLGEKTTRIHITLRTSSSPLYLTTVRAALDRLRPGLKTLDILESSAMSSTTSVPSFTDQYIVPYTWDNLESLSVTALSDNLLRHLVSLPGLRILKAAKLLRPGTNATPVNNGFPALGSLQVGSDVFSDMECILRLLPSSNELKSLQWSTFNCTTLSDRRGALQLVQRFCNPLKLSSLTLGEGISCDEPAEEPVDMDLDQDIDLSPLLGFSKLQNLALTLDAPVFIAPGDVAKLATAWPNLQHLNLCSSLYTSYIPRINHIDVVALASSLPLLQTLGLRFDATEVNGNEPQAHPSLRLRTLSVGASPICSPSRVAAFIDRQFPNLHHLGIYYSDRPSNPAEHSMLDTRWQAAYDAWLELASRNRRAATNIRLLQEAYRHVHAWLQAAGLSADPIKRELMHYCKPRNKKFDTAPHIRLCDTPEKAVPVSATVRWLGVHFDRHLRFEQHAKLLGTAGEAAVNGLIMLSNTVRGLSQIHLRRLYLACVIPKILYASPVWWNNTTYQRKPLEKVQNRALRLICAAFRTTPIRALELESSIPPLHIHNKLISRRCAIRFNKLPISSPIIRRLGREWHQEQDTDTNRTQLINFNPPLPPQPKRQRKKKPSQEPTTLLNLARLTDHRHERIDPFLIPPWRRLQSSFDFRIDIHPHPPFKSRGDNAKKKAADRHTAEVRRLFEDETNLVVYTDGSLIRRAGFTRVGASAVVYHRDQEVNNKVLGMGGHAEVFDGEMAALAMGINLATNFANNHPSISHIHFYVDNSSAASSIFNPRPTAGQQQSPNLGPLVPKPLRNSRE
ncbi:hypothetical protein NMY22_g19122 [Coprinellus aureogranulatus]|nr:hypothetical protein NMY22_g19122 [Coprinellus aureogranulatus]